jgi:hypothetical protein
VSENSQNPIQFDKQPAALTKNNNKFYTAECRTEVILDEPEITKALGPHKRIAETIANIIKDKSDGVSIGLEGNWGSGKSTVAGLLSKELESQKETVVLINFDAWAHEGDPLRRTFLETIIKGLQNSRWVNKDYWDNKIEEIAKRREVVSTKDTLALSIWGWMVGIGLFLVPIGSALLTAALAVFRDQKLVIFGSSPVLNFWVLFVFGLLLSLAPLLILLIARGKANDMLGMLFNKGATEKTTESIKTANPTSIEFEEIFNELLKEALCGVVKPVRQQNNGKKTDESEIKTETGIDNTSDANKIKDRRLVLILDNLDRVDSKDALAIWSTLQTFLQHKHRSSYSPDEQQPDVKKDWRRRLYLLVLYDLQGLSLLWSSSKKDDNKENHTETKTNRIATSFIDKSFQVRFEVPEPLLSDWKIFLTDQLKKAFPAHPSESLDFHKIYRVLAIQLAEEGRNPTYRELKLYVNQIGAIHRQWAASPDRNSDTFPLSHIAYYVLLRRKNEDIVDKLRRGELPDKKYVDLLKVEENYYSITDVKQSLASLIFNAEWNIAQQLLYGNEIKNDLEKFADAADEDIAGKETENDLYRKYATNLEAFLPVLEQTIENEWKGSEAFKIVDIALVLERAGLLRANSSLARQIYKQICDTTATVDSWIFINEKRASGLATIIKWKKVLSTNESDLKTFIETVYKAIAQGAISEAFPRSLSITDWLDYLEIPLKNIDRDTQSLAYKSFADTLTDTLGNLRRILEILFEIRDKYPEVEEKFTKLADNGLIESRLSRVLNPAEEIIFIEYGLYTLLGYASKDKLALIIQEAERESDLFFQVTEKETNSFFHDYLCYPYSETAYIAVKGTAEKLLKHNKYTHILDLASLDSSPDMSKLFPFIALTLQVATENNEFYKSFSDERAVERLNVIFLAKRKKLEQELKFNVPSTNDSFDKFIRELIEKTSVLDQIKSKGFDLKSCFLYNNVLLYAENDTRIDFKTWCYNNLVAIENYDWSSEIKHEGQLLELALNLLDEEFQIDLGENFLRALIEFTKSTQIRVKEKFRITKIYRLSELLGPINGTNRRRFREALHKKLIGLNGAISPAFFLVFNYELTQQFTILKEGENFERLFISILNNRDKYPLSLSWVRQLLYATEPETLDLYAKVHGLHKFRESVQGELFKDMDNKSLQTIASLLKVKY